MISEAIEMSSSSSSTTEVGPTEDVVLALLEYLVDPMLPLKSSAHEVPSISQQQSVARQMHAAVLLYNYYHRKSHTELEFLGFESFSKLAVTLKPSLMAHMKLIHRSDQSDPDDLENQLSLTEKAIMDACLLSKTLLDASQDVSSSLKKWAITKVAVLLIDSSKDNCLLLFSSVTNGVWSVIEKDLDSEDTTVGSKRKRINKRKLSLTGEQDADDEAAFQQLAFSAVKEMTGINGTELNVLESHVVYSLSKEKTAAQFYVVQCTQSINEDLQVPIKDAIDSLQGPVVKKSSGKKSSGSWIITPVVEYYHVLPYAGIMADWFSREGLSNSLQDRVGEGNVDVNISQISEKPFGKEIGESKGVFSNNLHNNLKVGLESVHVNSSKMEKPCDNEVIENRDGSNENCIASESVGKEAPRVNISELTENSCDKEVVETRNSSEKEASGANSEFPNQKGSSGSCMIGISNSSSGPQNMDIDKSPVVCPQKENENKNTPTPLKVYYPQKKRTPSTNVIKVKAGVSDLKAKSNIIECRDEKVDTEDKSCVISPHPDGVPTVDLSLVTIQQNTNRLEKVQLTMAAKNSELSETALRVLIRKREKLSNQLRNLEDELAVCNRNIQAILDGAENDLALKLEALIDCCNDVCLQDNMQAQDRANQHVHDQGLPQHVIGKTLSEAILTVRTPCQEMDDICRANNWTLPIYCVSPSDGGYVANVTVKGADFECSGGSDLRYSPREARDSAAVKMIAKLQCMASQAL